VGKSGTIGLSSGNGCVGDATSMENGSMLIYLMSITILVPFERAVEKSERTSCIAPTGP